MAEEVCLLAALAPELDGERQGMDRLPVAADERAAEVDALEVVLLGLQIRDLADVVTART